MMEEHLSKSWGKVGTYRFVLRIRQGTKTSGRLQPCRIVTIEKNEIRICEKLTKKRATKAGGHSGMRAFSSRSYDKTDSVEVVGAFGSGESIQTS
ncbi:hypothetical protein sS8_3549 [Methylocaldum marinum]|uniref:Uncharacterized protein n=1 Tax=Methylocaldum marinum TaxID=1432792 RepID=A0A250KVD3_9GAMM|nr:hypothetical protein [Methylocaldum marinum]BBA35486.1 hypothetical protein sS8_3549 [Methylocaldum marinum]